MCGNLKVPADLAGVTVVGLGVCGVLPELGDGVVERGKPGDLLLDVARATLRAGHERVRKARPSSRISKIWRIWAKVRPAAWPRWTKSIRETASADVVAVPGRRAVGRWQQPLFLIEAGGLRCCARHLGEFSDPHSGLQSPGRSPFDLPLYWKVQDAETDKISNL